LVRVVCAYHPNDIGKHKIEEGGGTGPSGQKQNPIYRKKKSKSDGGMTQIVDHLSSKCKALSSNSNMAKRKKKVE
jgi:hypothetical protein